MQIYQNRIFTFVKYAKMELLKGDKNVQRNVCTEITKSKKRK